MIARMKPIHALALALAATVVLSTAANATPGDRLEKEEKAAIPAAGRVSLTVKNARGRTVVVGRPGATAVSIVAVKTVVGRDDDDTRAMLDRLKMSVSSHGKEVVLETRDENNYDDWN